MKPQFTVKTFFFLPIFFVISTLAIAQNDDHRNCGMDSIQTHLMGLPGYEDDWRERVQWVDDHIGELDVSARGDCDNPLLIPVAAHFQNTGIPIGCAIDMALSQVETMNQDFGGYNPDITTWEALQPGLWPTINNAESCICFCLATLNHPDGFGLNEGDYAVTLDQTDGDNDAAWSEYLNFWVRTIGGGTLGYSPLGGTGNGDGVTVDPAYFGSTSCGGNTVNAPFNLGRTVTHEVGHYLLLDHPWGGGGCGSTDNIADTPVTDNAQFGCPAAEIINCDDPILWPSYMDYCDDACLFMFSAGQVERMETYVEGSLQNLLTNSVTACQEAICIGFDVDVTVTDESCDGNDGSINFTAIDGEAPFNYSLDGGLSFSPNATIMGLSENTFEIFVTDENGCEYSETVEIDRDGPVISVLSVDHEYCSDGAGAIQLSALGSDSFEFSLMGLGVVQDSPTFQNLSSDFYTIQVYNDTGCSGEVNVNIENQSDLDAIADIIPVNCTWFDNGKIAVTIIGGSEPFTYTLNETEESATGIFEQLPVGTHNVYMTDDDGCALSMDFELYHSFAELADDCPCQVFIPNSITPDGDGDNERLEVIPSCPIIGYHLQVFNRWGSIVFETNDLNHQWNGGHNGYFVDIGVYSYRMTFKWGDEYSSSIDYETKMGSVTVIR